MRERWICRDDALREVGGELRPPGKQWHLICCLAPEILKLCFLGWLFLSLKASCYRNHVQWRGMKLQQDGIAVQCKLSLTCKPQRCYREPQQMSMGRWCGTMDHRLTSREGEAYLGQTTDCFDGQWQIFPFSIAQLMNNRQYSQFSQLRLLGKQFSWCKAP